MAIFPILAALGSVLEELLQDAGGCRVGGTGHVGADDVASRVDEDESGYSPYHVKVLEGFILAHV